MLNDKELDEVFAISEKIMDVTLKLEDLMPLSKNQLLQVCFDNFGGILKGKNKTELRENIFLKSINIFND